MNNSVLSDGRTDVVAARNPRCDRKKEPVSTFAEHQLCSRGVLSLAWRMCSTGVRC